jgi:phosphate starvation-inducible PhoH-like protein
MLRKVFDILLKQQEAGETITSHSVSYTIELVKEGEENHAEELGDIIIVNARGKGIKSKTIGQKKYIDAIQKNEIVFGIGPAGTGKTYLAMAMAVKAFKNREVSRIVLTRPAVEAGEKLGFLPGDMQDKVDPYLRPLYDALHDIMGPETYQKHIERGAIEVAPLAYMRGRTLDDSYIILDEAQNTSPEQMKMFLTRMGFGSKAIITGDITQIDLPRGKYSGLKEVMEVLKSVKGIEFVYFNEKDVVRHKLVRDIIKAYEKYEDKKNLITGEAE